MRDFQRNTATWWRKTPRTRWHMSPEEVRGLQAVATQTWVFLDLRWILFSHTQILPFHTHRPCAAGTCCVCGFFKWPHHDTVVLKCGVKAPMHILKRWLSQKPIFNHVVNQREKESGGKCFENRSIASTLKHSQTRWTNEKQERNSNQRCRSCAGLLEFLYLRGTRPSTRHIKTHITEENGSA